MPQNSTKVETAATNTLLAPIGNHEQYKEMLVLAIGTVGRV